jgi:integrase
MVAAFVELVISETCRDVAPSPPTGTPASIRAQLDAQNAALVSVLAYEGLRAAEACALV